MRNYLLISLIFLFIIPISFSQQLSPQEEAMKFYSTGNYTEALVRFKKLSTLFPKDPKYFYFIGVCMVQTNTGIKDAEKSLAYAAEFAVPRDVYFYLGKALHYQYKFIEAIDAYQKFKSFGNPADHEKLQVDMFLAMARNGKDLTHFAKIKVNGKTPMEQDLLFTFVNKGLNGGQFRTKQNAKKGSVDNKEWRYEPYLSEKDIISFGSTQGMLRRNREIYVSRKNKNNHWLRPECLPVPINTIYDEDFVYFNEAENALYFASKGHNSIGGYDIFKSVYNPDYKTWSEPINMGYPINSPYNDYMFVPSDDQKTAQFSSDRETNGNKIIVYNIEFEKNYTYTIIPKGFIFKNVLPDTLEKVLAQIPLPVTQKKDSVKTSDTIQQIKMDSIIKEKPVVNNAYNSTINKALDYQLKSDSLNNLIAEQRENLNNTDNETTKSSIKTKIFQMDKQAKAYQSKADSLYIKAREFEKKTTGIPQNSTPVVTSEMAKSAFSQDKHAPQNELTTNKTLPVNNTPPSKKEKKTSVLYEFKVMSKSPYKTVEEIPLNQPLPDGVVYRIQMGAFSKTIEPDRFKGIIPISGETVNKAQVTKYYAGLFGRFADAEKALNKIKEYGFKDAFVVSFYNGKSIPTNRATDLEKNN